MIILVLFVLGLCFGSFVNALAWRLHEQEALADHKSPTVAKKRRQLSVLRGRSMCPHCNHQLTVKDLLPVLSWLSLKGKCRYCGQPIDWHYPLVELVTPMVFILSYVVWPYSFDHAGIVSFGLWLVFVTGLMALVVSDLKWMILPDKIVYVLMGVAVARTIIVMLLEQDWGVVASSIWGFVALGGLFYGLFQVSKGKWIGGGDVKLGFCLGVFVGGPAMAILLLFLSSSLGTVISLPLLLTGKASRNTRIPYGPFLIAATIITLLFGSTILLWYQRILS